MKYIVFGINNSRVDKFVIGIVEDNICLHPKLDEYLKGTVSASSKDFAKMIREYIFSQDVLPKSFTDTIKDYEEDYFRPSVLGVYDTIEDANKRVQYSLDSFERNRHRFPNKGCYNLIE